MKNNFKILGLSPSSTKKEREKAFKRLRSKYHPDKGGDSQKFNEVVDAYEKIKDLPPMSDDHYERTVRAENVYSGDGWFHNRRSQQFINIDAEISINKAINGGEYTLQIQLANTTKIHYIQIDVPPGITDGETINYPRLLLGNIDVHVVFNIRKDPVWSLEGLDIIKQETFDFWDLILGTTRDVTTLHGTKIRVTIPPKTQPGTKFRLKSHGASSRQNFLQKGDMIVQVQAMLPDDIPEDILARIREIKS